MSRLLRTSVADAFRRTALPLASYYAVTIAVPLANGAARSGAFVAHALAVLAVPPLAIILVCTICTIAGALGRRCRAATAPATTIAGGQGSRRRANAKTASPATIVTY